jgi:hypothetical protein
MPVGRGRGFTLADAMILIAAMAVGLGLIRADRGYRYYARNPQTVTMLADDSAILLACGTLAFLALRLRRPRPGWRHLARQPGMTACGAVAVWGAVECAMLILDRARLARRSFVFWGFPPVSTSFYQMLPSIAAPAVTVAWLTLAFTSCCRAEPGWLDRSGRALGVAWLALYVFRHVQNWL